MERKSKSERLSYWGEDGGPHFTLMDEPDEARVAASDNAFVSVRDGVITLAPGQGGAVNIQGMNSSLKFGGMISNTPFPLSLLPSTAATPTPAQKFSPPLQHLIGELRQLASIAGMFVGV